MIVSTESGGLGNRIKSWVSAMRLDADTYVYWPLTPNMPARFNDLFANDCAVDTVPDAAAQYSSWRLVVLPEDERHLPRGFATAGAGAHPVVRALGKAWWALTGERGDRYRYMLFPKQYSRRSTRSDGRHIDLEYSRIPNYFRRVYGREFARIRFQPEIAYAADRWAAENLDDRTIGLQVRTWRDHAKRRRKYHQTSLRRLGRLIHETDRASRFFLVSDSDCVAPWLEDAIGSRRVLQFPRRTTREASWASIDGMREDLIDMLLLARTPRLMASYLSTFSEVAWWLGGARSEVSVF